MVVMEPDMKRAALFAYLAGARVFMNAMKSIVSIISVIIADIRIVLSIGRMKNAWNTEKIAPIGEGS